MNKLWRFPIEALVAIVARETAMIDADLVKYGEHQFNPRTPAYQELDKRFEQALESEVNNG